MDQVRAMKIFVRIYERSSFTAAAEDLEIPRATLTHVMNQFEQWLGTRLLERSTRRVRPTLDGEAYYRRCVNLLAELEEAELAFRQSVPKGRLRVDLHGTLARFFVIPALPAFMQRYPGIELSLSETDRFVDLIEEGVDCVVRAGTLGDSSLIGRHLADLPQVTCASPVYVSTYGEPQSVAELLNHKAINYISRTTGKPFPFDFQINGTVQEVAIPTAISVFGAEIYTASALAGIGLIQVPRYRVAKELQQGMLCELLPGHPPPPMPVSVLYPHNRHLSPRVRVFVEWLKEIFTG
ncbi:LysR family transcriptional regulator [Pseudomonas sp. YuFO8]|jgi:DNA-binding transcriptional LysR family regulator|uniref:LysR family transcriptional regulator n=1 Tax=Pseudomonas sp. YuFO8 TaxID=3095361 RepID=UPI002B2546AB|nr:LysR family transcriptional regulator [Pseudomonas sp. YuFO8]MEB2621130.1 LysR family transcriptional regulator [Pseudomonas sp. YuFO8]